MTRSLIGRECINEFAFGSVGPVAVRQSARLEPCVASPPPKNELMRILVVEDDKKTGTFITKALRADGFAVDLLRDGDDALGGQGVQPDDDSREGVGF